MAHLLAPPCRQHSCAILGTRRSLRFLANCQPTRTRVSCSFPHDDVGQHDETLSFSQARTQENGTPGYSHLSTQQCRSATRKPRFLQPFSSGRQGNGKKPSGCSKLRATSNGNPGFSYKWTARYCEPDMQLFYSRNESFS